MIEYGYGPMVVFVSLHFILPHYHHYAYVFEGVGRMKYLSGTLCQVCLWLSPFSQLSFMQYMGLWVFSVLNSRMMIVKIWEYVYSIYYHRHQIRSMAHLPLFKLRSWNNRMRYMSFNIIILSYDINCKNFQNSWKYQRCERLRRLLCSVVLWPNILPTIYKYKNL